MQLALCGQAPQAITDAALTAINFYVEQQALGGAYTNHKLKQRMDAVQAQCKSKLTDMHNAYQQVRAPAGSARTPTSACCALRHTPHPCVR
jgi:ribosomal protein S2